MVGRIEDYAIIGNCLTVALVSRDGSIDWLSLPRFNSPTCFAALLGTPEHGRWLIAPANRAARVTRSYREGTLVLETEFQTATGAVVVIDCLARRGEVCDVIRLVRGLQGWVAMQTELIFRFEYGLIVPWVSRLDDGRLGVVAGADRLVIATPLDLKGEGVKTIGRFNVDAGQEIPFVLSWAASYRRPPASVDAAETIERVTRDWRDWSSQYGGEGEWSAAARRSLITLKALTHHWTGGIVAAGTTSLPEQLGGERNWDYRFCWLRDSTFTLCALMNSGFLEEAKAWRDWLLRAVAGSPEMMQIMYGVAGERRLTEFEIPWLPGYEGALPVRVGNAASNQLQLDVYGEVVATLYHARKSGLAKLDVAWNLARALVEHLENIWDKPDNGIWEVRGGRRHFTHSKVMAWVAFDRAVRAIEEFSRSGPLTRWRRLRNQIHADICRNGFDPELGSFVQSYGSKNLDASVLCVATMGFLPPTDPRVRGTVEAIEKRLMVDGLVLRYDTLSSVDGLPPGEGAFLACSFWLADCLVLLGRIDDARRMFERLLALRNDVGLLAEEYDLKAGRQVGNFPQAFSHVGLINTAHNLTRALKPVEQISGHRVTSAA